MGRGIIKNIHIHIQFYELHNVTSYSINYVLPYQLPWDISQKYFEDKRIIDVRRVSLAAM